MFMSLSMFRSCSGATPNSAARSCTLVLTTQSSIMSVRAPTAPCRRPTRGRVRLPPSLAAFQAARRSRRRAGPRRSAHPSPMPAGPPCPRRAGWRPPPRPRTNTFRPATLSAPRRPRPRCAGPGTPGPGARAVRPCGGLLLAAVLVGELGEEAEQLLGGLGRDARDLGDVLALEVEDVVEHPVAGALEDHHELGRQALELAE